MVCHIEVWPNWGQICHDLVFMAASAIAICGFLRGGKFLSYSGSARPVLRHKDKAASRRAGGMRSALDAGIIGPMIMAMGRWRSLAWESYIVNRVLRIYRELCKRCGVRVRGKVESFHIVHRGWGISTLLKCLQMMMATSIQMYRL
jgi:hypothetical protein